MRPSSLPARLVRPLSVVRERRGGSKGASGKICPKVGCGSSGEGGGETALRIRTQRDQPACACLLSCCEDVRTVFSLSDSVEPAHERRAWKVRRRLHPLPTASTSECWGV